MAKQQKRVLILKTGEEFPITGENGRYWLCEGANFRKSNKDIAGIKAEKPVRKTAEENSTQKTHE